jgi:hypothetical protein
MPDVSFFQYLVFTADFLNFEKPNFTGHEYFDQKNFPRGDKVECRFPDFRSIYSVCHPRFSGRHSETAL